MGTYEKLLKCGFQVEKTEAGVVAKRSYWTMRIVATLDGAGKTIDLHREATTKAWALGIAGFPWIAAALYLYRNSKTKERLQKMRTDISIALRN